MSERQPQILDIEKVIKSKAGKNAKYIPKFLINWFKNFMHLDYINGYLKEGYVGVEFCENALKYLGVTLEVEGLEHLPKDGRRYTFVSNHPLGAIDGVTLGAVIGKEYEGKIKYLMNDLLMNLKGMAPLGIPINKLGGQARNLPRLINEVYSSDNQMLVFPAGLCSRMIEGKIQDIEWGKSFVKMSRETGRDIVPIHFEGRNSDFFYNLANLNKILGIKFNIAMLYLADEMFKNRGKTFKVTIGKPIAWQTFDKSKKPSEWAQHVQDIVYSLNRQ